MPRKEYNLSPQIVEIIHEVMKEAGFKYEVDAVSFIIKDYKERKQSEEIIANMVAEKLDKTLTRIRLGTRTAEQNSMLLLHMMNTEMYRFFPSKNDYLMPASGSTKHWILKEAEDTVGRMIAAAKQRKDDAKSREGIE